MLMGDTRQKGCMIPMYFDVMKIFQDAGLTLKELIINLTIYNRVVDHYL